MKKKKLTPKKISESVNNKFPYWLPISADNRSHHHKRECRRVQIERPDKQPATLGHGAGGDRVVAIKADWIVPQEERQRSHEGLLRQLDEGAGCSINRGIFCCVMNGRGGDGATK